MAKIVYGPIVSDARKKIAGVVATKGHAGNFMRKKVSPIQPRSGLQRTVRADFSAHAKAWAGLGASVIAGFNALAKTINKKDRFGQSVTLTGLQLFQSLSRNIDTVSGTPLSAVPASLDASTPGALTLVITSGGTPAFTVTPANYPATGESAAIYASPQLSPGRSYVGKNYRLVLVVPYSGSPTAFNVLTNYVAKFGTLVSGKNIYVLVKNINTTTGGAGSPSAKMQAAT